MAIKAIQGTDGNDFLLGTHGNDVILGKAGNDLMLGDQGNDRMEGGDDADLLIGGSGDDTLIGDKGDDFIFAGTGNDRMIWNNGDGSDFMRGGTGYDVTEVNGALEAGDAFELRARGHQAEFERVNLGNFKLNIDDTEAMEINGGGGDDSLSVGNLAHTDIKQVTFDGGNGNDTLAAGESTQTIVARGGKGKDLLVAGSGDDTLHGGRGQDTLKGGSGRDMLRGGRGNDVLQGDKGDDVMRGGRGNDRMIWNNGDGSDTMRGGQGQDVTEVNGALEAGDHFELSSKGDRVDFRRVNLGLFQLDIDNIESMEINGGGGNDSLTVKSLARTDLKQVNFSGGEGDDFLDGSAAEAAIVADGGAGNDTLIGSAGDDTLIGGEGADLLISSGGNDVLVGGAGADIFRFSFEPGVSVIQDFNLNEDILQFQQNTLPQARMGSVSSIRESLTYNSESGAISLGGTHIATLESPVSGFDINSHVEII